MLDIKLIREKPEVIQDKLKSRDPSITLDKIMELDQLWRAELKNVEELKALRNSVSEEISRLKKEKKNADEKITAMRKVGEQIKELDEKIRQLEIQIQDIMLTLPNLPHESVPIGLTEDANSEIRKWGNIPSFSFEPLPHWELGELHDVLDFTRASQIAGARFNLYKGWGARLERALINFMLDIHTLEDGYTEIYPPILANRDSLIGSGQLPKFESEMFKCADDPYYLISTSEISLVNIHRGEILKEEQLPICYTAFTPCFRREAGAAGKDTRGLIRNHQFNKVEMVKFTKPEDSFKELEKLTADAEKVLKLLNLPYRVVEHCTGDLGFTASKSYDLEVWFPTQKCYREISSCSNVEDFQSRRCNIRFKRAQNSKPEFVHTLNGSGLAIGRTWAAILENCQTENRSVKIPEALQTYMNGVQLIELKSLLD